MDVLIDLAAYADIRGLDWQTLNASGQGVMQNGGYLDVLETRWGEFYGVAETLDISAAEWEETTAKEAADAWHEVRDAIGEKASLMLDALSAGELRVAMEHAATIWTGSLRKLIIATSHVSHRNLTAHSDGTLYELIAAGELTVEDVEEEASSIARLWDAIVKLDSWNALSSLKKPEYGGTAGLGQAQGAAAQVLARGIPMAIAVIGIAAVIASIIVFLSYLSDRNKQIDQFCFDKDGALREGRPSWCDEAGQGMPDPLAIFLEPFRSAGERLATGLSVVAGIVGVLWVGSLILPRLAESAARRRAA